MLRAKALGSGLFILAVLTAVSGHAWRAAAPGETRGLAVDAADDVVAVGDGVDFTVVKYAGASGAELWRVDVDGTASSFGDAAGAVAVDAAGDVIAVGRLENAGTGNDLAVLKLAGSNGMELWRVEIDGTASGADFAAAVAIDAAGDVVVAGRVDDGGDELTVVKLAGATGDELWRYGVVSDVGATDVDVDGVGDVVAAGATTNLVTGDDFAVVKLAGATGAELWRYEVSGSAGDTSDQANALAIDAAGDMVAAGWLRDISGTDTHAHFTVKKLDGTTGDELWSAVSPNPGNGFHAAWDVVVDAAGDAIAVGIGISGQGFVVMKIAGGDGDLVWLRTVSEPSAEFGSAGGVALDAADDVLAAGHLFGPGSNTPVAVAKFDGATGDERWRQVLDTAPPSFLMPLALQSQGAPVVGGPLDAAIGNYAVVRLSALDGAVGPVRGKRVVVRDFVGAPTRRGLRFILRDGVLVSAPPGSSGDPTVSGGVLTLANPTTLESADFPLPAGSWNGIGSPPGARGWRYVDTSGANGPCRRVVLKAGKILTASCSGSLGAFPFSLDEATQGSLTVSLTTGGADGQCATFGGDVQKDAGTANPGPVGAFQARNAPAALGTCP